MVKTTQRKKRRDNQAEDQQLIRINVLVPLGLWKAAKHVGVERRASFSELVREGLEAVLAAAKKR